MNKNENPTQSNPSGDYSASPRVRETLELVHEAIVAIQTDWSALQQIPSVEAVESLTVKLYLFHIAFDALLNGLDSATAAGRVSDPETAVN